MQTQPTFDFCQRWTDRKDSFRPAGEPIDTARYGVEVIEQARAKAFVESHHYSGSFPAARLSVGMFEARPFAAPALVGVAVFSVPIQQAAARKHLNLTPAEVVELGRFVLVDAVPGNGETWFLARAFRALREEKADVRGVLSYADPSERVTADGQVVKPGHYGTIYQAHNARYVGRSSSRTLTLDRAGRVISGRGLSKIRRGERGAEGAIRRLVDAGAPSPLPHEAGDAYVKRALAEGPFRKVRHPGNLTFTWGLDKRAKKGLPEGLAYPKAHSLLAA